MEKTCAECGQKLIGRIDKKFCNDQCRTAWHNKHHNTARNDPKPGWFFTNPSVVYLFIEK